MKAIIFVDVQKDFIDGALRNEKAIEVTPKIVEFAKECKEKGYQLFATRDTHEKTIYNNPALVLGGRLVPESGYMTTLEGRKLPVEHCVEGSDGWMIDSRLMDVFFEGYAKDEAGAEDKDHPIFNCTFVNKPTFGSFDLVELFREMTDFEHMSKVDFEILEKNGKIKCLDEIVICGFCTDICVVSSAILLRAAFPNMKITVMKDLCAGVTPETHEAALKTMQMCQIDVV